MSDTLAKDIGKRIRTRREELNLTREQLAEKSDLSIQFLADIETGRSNMTTVSLSKIATALDLSCDYIVFGSVKPFEPSDVTTMLASLSARDRQLAEDILKSFVKSANK